MFSIKVSEIIWNALSDAEKLTITTHLRHFRVLKPTQNVVADANTPVPSLFHQDSTVEVDALLIDWICRSICQSTGAADCCTHKEQGIKGCLIAIRDFRETHMKATAEKYTEISIKLGNT